MKPSRETYTSRDSDKIDKNISSFSFDSSENLWPFDKKKKNNISSYSKFSAPKCIGKKSTINSDPKITSKQIKSSPRENCVFYQEVKIALQ